tara:strand:+ start:11683 stop:12000 length:318 start_codon:yes stop_codon:yes gene_type:complete
MNIVEGTVVSLEIPIFRGSFRNAKFVRDATIEKAICIKEKYGHACKHWFTFEILESSDSDFPKGMKKRMQGKNAYRCATVLDQPKDEDQKTQSKKTRKEINKLLF